MSALLQLTVRPGELHWPSQVVGDPGLEGGGLTVLVLVRGDPHNTAEEEEGSRHHGGMLLVSGACIR